MKDRSQLTADLLAAWARARGLPLDPGRAEAIRRPVQSLVGRLRGLADPLGTADGPPPESPEGPPR